MDWRNLTLYLATIPTFEDTKGKEPEEKGETLTADNYERIQKELLGE